MPYLLAAKIVVVFHIGFVAFLFLGGIAIARRRRLIWLHALCLIYAILAMGGLWPCPLTLLEQSLLERAGVAVYHSEFLPHYLWQPLGLIGSEPIVVAFILLALAVANWSPYRSFFRTRSQNANAA